MSEPWFRDETLTLHEGHAARVMATMDDGSVDCVVTSPPYFGLRDYGGQPEQIGLEASPVEYVAALVEVFAEVRRVLAKDGTLWLNLGDTYASQTKGGGGATGYTPEHGNRNRTRYETRRFKIDVPEKNLLGVPWRTAFALQDAGWYLRNAVVWSKPNAMPESVRDRLSNRHELLFLLTKSRSYWFDLDAIRVPHLESTAAASLRARKPYQAPGQKAHSKSRPMASGGANPGDVWELPTRPFPEAHFATFPIDLPRRCILAGCRPGGTVLDPFAGAGTTLLAAQQLGRRAIGIDLHPDYLKMALRRCQDAPLFTDKGVSS